MGVYFGCWLFFHFEQSINVSLFCDFDAVFEGSAPATGFRL
jgi:hypothetical protein